MKVLVVVSVVMFILGTVHISLNCIRLVQGYTEDPAGPLDFFPTMHIWSHIAKNVVYVTQEVLGSVAAVRIFRVQNPSFFLMHASLVVSMLCIMEP